MSTFIRQIKGSQDLFLIFSTLEELFDGEILNNQTQYNIFWQFITCTQATSIFELQEFNNVSMSLFMEHKKEELLELIENQSNGNEFFFTSQNENIFQIGYGFQTWEKMIFTIHDTTKI